MYGTPEKRECKKAKYFFCFFRKILLRIDSISIDSPCAAGTGIREGRHWKVSGPWVVPSVRAWGPGGARLGATCDPCGGDNLGCLRHNYAKLLCVGGGRDSTEEPFMYHFNHHNLTHTRKSTFYEKKRGENGCVLFFGCYNNLGLLLIYWYTIRLEISFIWREPCIEIAHARGLPGMPTITPRDLIEKACNSGQFKNQMVSCHTSTFFRVGTERDGFVFAVQSFEKRDWEILFIIRIFIRSLCYLGVLVKEKDCFSRKGTCMCTVRCESGKGHAQILFERRWWK